MTRSEFGYGTFQRIISLPARVQNDQVKANYKDGILYLHLPKCDRIFPISLTYSTQNLL